MRRSAVSKPFVDSRGVDIAASGLCIDDVAHTGFVAGLVLELADLGLLLFLRTVGFVGNNDDRGNEDDRDNDLDR